MEIDIKDEHLRQLLTVKLQQLDLEMQREKERVETSGAGHRALGLIEVDFSLKKREVTLEYQQRDKEKQTQGLPESFVKFENDSLVMRLSDGSTGTINFSSKLGGKDMLSLFAVMFGVWKQQAKFNDGWWEALVTKEQLRGGMQESAKRGDSFLKDTIGNIRKFKLEKSIISNYVSIGYYDRKLGGWPFKIKVPQENN